MKKKFSKVLGVGLSLALLTGLLVSMVPASAATLSLSTDLAPPAVFPYKTAKFSDIESMAVNGSTIYAARGDGDSIGTWDYYVNTLGVPLSDPRFLLKSTDGGSGWADLSTSTAYPTGQLIRLVAVAPDDADVVAIVYSSGNISLSDDGGSSWSALGQAGTGATINAIDISPLTGGYYYIAAGTGATSGVAELYVREMSMTGSWTAQSTGDGYRASEKIMAVKFSPNFDIDKIIACISANDTAQEVYFQVLEYESPTYYWNGSISATGWAGWATGIELDVSMATLGGVGTDLGPIASASIAMYDGYLGTDADERVVFVGVSGNTSSTADGGVSRLYDNALTAVTNWSGAAPLGPTHSLAYKDGTLLAGLYYSNTVYRCLDALAIAPRCERQNTLKQPGGTNKTVVAWSGSKVVTGTSGDESAISVSTDDGYAFNDVSLIDSMIYLGTVADIAVTPDGGKIYVAAVEDSDVSVWTRVAGVLWTRVLSLPAQSNTDVILRIAPDDPDVIYLVCRDDGNIWRTADGGKTRWKDSTIKKITAVQDFAVESADVAYAISTSSCTKTSNGGVSWGTLQPIKIAGHTVIVASNGDVLIGGSAGNIAWSKDGGATFDRTPAPLGFLYAGRVHVLPDADYESNGIVYGTNDGDPDYYPGQTIYRGTLSTAMPILESYGPLTIADDSYEFYGLAQSEGVVYALSSNSTNTYIYRALNLRDAETTAEVLWSSYNSTANTGTTAANTVQNLKMSDGPKVWATSLTTSGLFLSLTDPIAIEAPTPIAPADEFIVPMNPASGNAYDVTFSFERYDDTDITSMQLQVATDDEFNAIVYNQTFTDIATNVVSVVLGTAGTAYGVSTACSLMPETTYYWRVRVALDAPALSPWSEVRSLTVGDLEVAGAVTVEIPDAAPSAVTAVAPAMGAMDVPLQPTLVWPAVEGATGYEVMVSEYAAFDILEWSHTTDQNFYPADEPFAYDTTYYWRARASEPEEGAWTTGVFTTMAKPAEPVVEEPTIITVPGETEVVTVEVEKAAAIPNYLLWTIIAIGAVLVIALIVLIVRTRRVA